MSGDIHIPESLNQTGQTVGFGIKVGIVDLMWISCNHDLGALPRTADNGFYFMG